MPQGQCAEACEAGLTMGLEATCRVTCPAGDGTAKALLESTEVVVRGAFRWKVSFAELQSVEIVREALVLRSQAGDLSLELGESIAARWAEKIRNPPTLMKKLGVKAGTPVAVLGEAAPWFLEQLHATGAVMDSDAPEILFVFAAQERDLVRAWNQARSVWVVYPKGRRTLTELQVIAAGREAGMKDTKVASVSTELTGLRFSRAVGSV